MPNKAVFLERDNTIIDDQGYINHPNQVELMPGAAESLNSFKKMGFLRIMVTNQPAVARGIVTEDVLEQVHQRVKSVLLREGAELDAIYYCPYHPNGVIPEYRKESELRMPDTGMLIKACSELDIDLKKSWIIGNSYDCVNAGVKASCRTILVNSPARPAYKKLGDPTPDKEAVNIKEAANIVRMFESRHENVMSGLSGQTAAEPSQQKSAEEKARQKPRELYRPLEKNVEENAPREPAPKEPIEKTEHQAAFSDKKSRASASLELLEEAVGHLKGMRRADSYEEFSVMKMLAGILQIVVIFCLVLSLWFLLDPHRGLSWVHTSLAYAAVLQLTAIAFYVMKFRDR